MASVAGRSLTAAELEKTLRHVDADVLLVRSRVLQRVIREAGSLPLLGVAVPHRKTYVISRDRLLQFCTLEDLSVSTLAEVPARTVLLGRPSSEDLQPASSDATLLKYWRLLFHAGVHKVLESAVAVAKLTPAVVRERVRQIGQTNFEEIRHVLREEHFLIHPHDDRSVYVEFAALYLELQFFANDLLIHYFPSLSDTGAVDALLRRDIDYVRLFEQTRPPGAPDPVQRDASPVTELRLRYARHVQADDPPRLLNEEERREQLRKASAASAKGNSVRALLLEKQASVSRGPDLAPVDGGDELNRFVDRLERALRFPDSERERWRWSLQSLLPFAARGAFPIEARLLYDLQRTCLDYERMTYSDIVDWISGLGRRRYLRPLPMYGLVRQVKHLRSAEGRTRLARVPEVLRSELLDLIAAELHRAEERVCQAIRPIIGDALDSVGLRPMNVPEELARTKVIEELLDRIVEHGFFSMADVRDAIARNRLKLPDLRGPFEFAVGDPLLRLNRRLADSLAGIYHAGEVYLRVLQRTTSLFFGNGVGRLLTLFLLLPFGGAFVGLYFVHFMLEEGHRYFGMKRYHVMPAFSFPMPEADLARALTQTFIVGVVFFALMHWRGLRLFLWGGLQSLGDFLRLLLWQWPLGVLRSAPVRALVESRPALFIRRHVLRPAVLTFFAWSVARVAGLDAGAAVLLSAAVLIVSTAFFNSRLGRVIEERAVDWLALFWQAIRLDLIPGFIRWTLARFQHLISLSEQLLYTVDEWLRFRAGDSRFALVYKPVLELAWFLVAYLIRFTINLVVEPQVNPIKHFPVVTVSHKFIFPFALLAKTGIEERLAGAAGESLPHIRGGGLHFDNLFRRMSPKTIGGIFGLGIQFIIPGICGYLAWELPSNWRLYRKNQSPTLDPVAIGHHGETMLRFIRPGLHSGTVPKLHARIRKAMRRGRWRRFNKRQADLHHVEESIRRFVEREFIALLMGSRSWRGQSLEVGTIRLGSNNIQIEVRSPGSEQAAMRIGFEQQGGWLIAGVVEKGWAQDLEADRRVTLTNALTGFYKLCGVDLVREQVASHFDFPCHWLVEARGLVVFPDDEDQVSVVYPLKKTGLLEPAVEGRTSRRFDGIPAEQLLFSAVPVTWEKWVETWNRDRRGDRSAALVNPGTW